MEAEAVHGDGLPQQIGLLNRVFIGYPNSGDYYYSRHRHAVLLAVDDAAHFIFHRHSETKHVAPVGWLDGWKFYAEDQKR